MSSKDYKVGFGKPPMHTRYQKGICPNPKGRGARKDFSEKAAFRKILNGRVPYTTKGKRKKGTRLELLVRQRGSLALKGDVKSAIALLILYEQFSGAASDNVDIVTFTGGPSPSGEGGGKISDR